MTNQVLPGSTPEEQSLADACTCEISCRQQQRSNTDTAGHMQNFVRTLCPLEVFVEEEPVAQRREQSRLISRSECGHRPSAAADDFVEKLNDSGRADVITTHPDSSQVC